jgi:hypothetical protein
MIENCRNLLLLHDRKTDELAKWFIMEKMKELAAVS